MNNEDTEKKPLWESSTSVLNHYFKPFYRFFSWLLEKKINWEVSKEFYVFLSLFFVILFIKFGVTSVNFLLISLPLLALVELLSLNIDNLSKLFYKDKIDHSNFLSKLPNIEIEEVEDYIYENHKTLDDSFYLTVLESKKGRNEDIQQVILRYFKGSDNFIRKFLESISKKKIEMPRKIQSLYLWSSNMYLDSNLINLVRATNNPYCIGVLKMEFAFSEKLSLSFKSKLWYAYLNFIGKGFSKTSATLFSLLILILMYLLGLFFLIAPNVQESDKVVFMALIAYFLMFLFPATYNVVKSSFNMMKNIILFFSSRSKELKETHY